MPIEYALTTQFAAFVALYFVDSRAATRGWAPHWYGTYRFLLTAMVGMAILVSLVGRANIGQRQAHHELQQRLETPGLADHETDWAKLEKEEKKRVKKEKEKARKKAEKEEQEKKQQELKERKGHKPSEKDEDGENEGGEKEEKNSSETKYEEDKPKDNEDSGKSKDGEDGGKSKDN